jgi:hypothetical protein
MKAPDLRYAVLSEHARRRARRNGSIFSGGYNGGGTQRTLAEARFRNWYQVCPRRPEFLPFIVGSIRLSLISSKANRFRLEKRKLRIIRPSYTRLWRSLAGIGARSDNAAMGSVDALDCLVESSPGEIQVSPKW